MATAANTATPTDLTSRRYWDQRWDGVREGAGVAKAWLRRRLGFTSGPLYRFLAEQADAASTAEGEVLELGCAPGSVLSHVQALRPAHRYHGVDFSAEGIKDAKRLFDSKGRSVELHHADLRDFNPAQKYDVVFSCGLVEHFTNPLEILQHHVRLAAPGGRVVVTMPNYTGLVQKWVIRQLDPPALVAHNLQTMRVARIQELMAAAGLGGVQAGTFGRASLRVTQSTRGMFPAAVRTAASVWNEASRIVPTRPCRRHYVWASGVVN